MRESLIREMILWISSMMSKVLSRNLHADNVKAGLSTVHIYCATLFDQLGVLLGDKVGNRNFYVNNPI